MAAEYLARMGEQIRERREELRLSRADLARQMPGKVNENQIYRWEKGLHQPNSDTLEALAKLLGTNVASLLAPPGKATEETPDPFEADVPVVLRQLSDRIAGLDEQVRLLRAELAVRDAEALRRSEPSRRPTRKSR